MSKVALCLIATGKYDRFLPECLRTAGECFLDGHDVTYFVFADRLRPGENVVWRPTPHNPWPWPTLYRYHTMLQAKKELLQHDYLYYLDVDSRFVRPVGEEIFGDLVGTIHPGYAGQPKRNWTFETRPQSRACVSRIDAQHYYCGGFQGGAAERWVRAMEEMAAMIDDDAARGIVPVWHDESIVNRYFLDNPPALSLSPDYCCYAHMRRDTRRIEIVGKNNGEFHR